MSYFSSDAIQRTGLASEADVLAWLHSAHIKPDEISESDLPSIITRCRDEQEAKSFAYSDEVVLILMLKSGNFAIFGNDRRLVEIVSPDEMSTDYLKSIIVVTVEQVKGRVIHAKRLRDVGAAESDDREFAKQLRRARTPERHPVPEGGADIDLDMLEAL